jgi:hypothetical protein
MLTMPLCTAAVTARNTASAAGPNMTNLHASDGAAPVAWLRLLLLVLLPLLLPLLLGSYSMLCECCSIVQSSGGNCATHIALASAISPGLLLVLLPWADDEAEVAGA